jgi:hypothetical protein
MVLFPGSGSPKDLDQPEQKKKAKNTAAPNTRILGKSDQTIKPIIRATSKSDPRRPNNPDTFRETIFFAPARAIKLPLPYEA